MRDFTRVFAAFLYENRNMCGEICHFAGTPKTNIRDIHVKCQLCTFVFFWVSPLVCMRAYKFYNFRDIYFESITYFCPL